MKLTLWDHMLVCLFVVIVSVIVWPIILLLASPLICHYTPMARICHLW